MSKDIKDESLDLSDNSEVDKNLQAEKSILISARKKHILIYGSILIIFVLFISIFSGTSKKKDDIDNDLVMKQQNDAQLQAKLDKAFAKLNKKDIRVLTAPAEPKVEKPQLNNISKALMNAPLNLTMNSDAKSTNKQSPQQSANLPSGDGYGGFANSQPTGVITQTASKIKRTNWTVVQGELLHGVLNTAISSEIQGNVTATLTQPAYSYTGQNELLPIGSRLIGSYAMASAGNGMAATRIFIIWNRVVTPSGISIMINSASTGNLGMTGTAADVVDRHFFLIFGSSTLISIIGAGTANISSGAPGGGQSSQQTYLSAVQQSFSSTANSLLGRFSSVSPTLYANQGKEISIFLNKDLNMYGAYNVQK